MRKSCADELESIDDLKVSLGARLHLGLSSLYLAVIRPIYGLQIAFGSHSGRIECFGGRGEVS